MTCQKNSRAGAILAFATLGSSCLNLQAQSLERVEITGSAIRRIQAETALPVQIIKRTDIQASGASSTVDLLQKLPAIQNSITEADTVGGSGGGFAGVSLHNLGENRTLVLLNGHRIASYGGQDLLGGLAAIDLNTIPLAAIERVELLTDGASAIYGSDAIGGVVNFITRRRSEEGEATIGFSVPRGGARESRVSASKGIGDLDKDGYNLLLAFSADKRTALSAKQRDFAKTAILDFEYGGRTLRSFSGSSRSIPANVPVNLADGSVELRNPALASTGQCPPDHLADGPACYYDYATQLEIYPERKRENILTSFSKLIGDQRLYADILLARTSSISRTAPAPGEVRLNSTSPFYATAASLASGAGESVDDPVAVSWRMQDAGRRTNEDRSRATHFTLGSTGNIQRWDYDASYTYSQNKYESFLRDGWLSLNRLSAALNNPGSSAAAINPFASPGGQTPEALAAIRNARILGYWDGGTSRLDQLQLHASTELAQLEGGPLALATGVSYLREQFQSSPSELLQGRLTADGRACDPTAASGSLNACDTRFGSTSTSNPYTSARHSAAIFGEILAPLTSELELSTSARLDQYSDFGSAFNYKFAARLQPSKDLLLRTSLGTGFRAPTPAQVNAPRQDFGVTASRYACPLSAAQLAAIAPGTQCPTGNVQYNIIAAGNQDLAPERSQQFTLGLLAEPTPTLSFGLDYWLVHIRDAIDQIDPAAIFSDPQKYLDKFTYYDDPGTGQRLLAAYLPNANLGKKIESGLDLNTRMRLGPVTTQLAMTYMLRDDYQLERGGAYYTSLGQYGPNGRVTFRWQGRLANTMQWGRTAHTLTANFKSGYRDQQFTADDCQVYDPATLNCADVLNRKVSRYLTFDWNTRWQVMKGFDINLGVLNLADRNPPLSITTAGGGQMVGYDARYYDSRDRTYYISASYRF
ncbi:MAG: TonB-dependent receptor plug domain-containing protein [Leptothrix sp. (in: b-proteobacteria)]